MVVRLRVKWIRFVVFTTNIYNSSWQFKVLFLWFWHIIVWFVSIGTELYLRYNPQQFRDRPKCYKRLSSGNPFIHETVAMISFVTHAKSHMNDKEHKLQKYLSRFNKYTILGYLSCGVFHFFCSWYRMNVTFQQIRADGYKSSSKL